MAATLARSGMIALLAAGLAFPAAAGHLDVPNLFASVCGFCHEDGGRHAGKGPQLMNTERSDDFIRKRIREGKRGRMPAFGRMFSDEDIDEIIAYIRALKPREQASTE